MCCRLPCKEGQDVPHWKPLVDEVILLDTPPKPSRWIFTFEERGIDNVGHFEYRVKVWEQPTDPAPGTMLHFVEIDSAPVEVIPLGSRQQTGRRRFLTTL